MLIHDRAKAHQSGGSMQIIKGSMQRCMVIKAGPPRSPDLMPLDYGCFGAAKARARATTAGVESWQQRANYFIQQLYATKVERIIKVYPGRLKECVKRRGGHVEASLHFDL